LPTARLSCLGASPIIPPPTPSADIPSEADVTAKPVQDTKPSGDDLRPNATHCDSSKVVKITSNLKNDMAVKYSTFVKNNTSGPIDFKFTSKKSGTTTIGGSVTFSGEVKMLWLGKIKTEAQANATVYGDYGIMKENIYGYFYSIYSNCTVSPKTYAKVWAPYREGWVVK
jgi:hypothetical protein